MRGQNLRLWGSVIWLNGMIGKEETKVFLAVAGSVEARDGLEIAEDKTPSRAATGAPAARPQGGLWEMT